MKRLWKTAGKALTGGVGVVVAIVANGALHGNALAVANGLIAAATYVGIYHAPYTPTTPTK